MSVPAVYLPQGIMYGTINTTVSKFQYYSFQGMPYARPPLGDLRFRV